VALIALGGAALHGEAQAKVAAQRAQRVLGVQVVLHEGRILEKPADEAQVTRGRPAARLRRSQAGCAGQQGRTVPLRLGISAT
jgi:hypothetical protein